MGCQATSTCFPVLCFLKLDCRDGFQSGISHFSFPPSSSMLSLTLGIHHFLSVPDHSQRTMRAPKPPDWLTHLECRVEHMKMSQSLKPAHNHPCRPPQWPSNNLAMFRPIQSPGPSHHGQQEEARSSENVFMVLAMLVGKRKVSCLFYGDTGLSTFS